MARVKTTPTGSFDDDKARREAAARWAELVRRLGKRYAECYFKNYTVERDAQRVVVDRLKDYARHMRDNVSQGRNIVLFGKPGTGKDHLIVAMMRQACQEGLTVAWIDGMGLFEQRRDAIDTDIRERDIIGEYTTPDVLAISDPVPPWGDLAQGQAEFLFRLIDRRYRSMKPVWISANVSGGDDAKKRIGAQVVDRLRDGAIALHCDWDSFREPS